MSLDAQRAYLTPRMEQVETGLPMALPNQPFQRPKDSAYGEFHIMGGDSFDVGMESNGKKRVRYVHMLQMTIWIPDEKGIKAATTAGDRFGDRFKNRQGRDPSGGFYRFKSLQTITPGKTQQGWDVHVFRIPYTRDVVEDVAPGLTL